MRENGRNSVRRPRIASLTDRNCEGFSPPGNRVGLPELCEPLSDAFVNFSQFEGPGDRARNLWVCARAGRRSGEPRAWREPREGNVSGGMPA